MCRGIQSWPFESHPWPPTWAANSLTTELQLQQLVLSGSVIQVMLEARCSHKVCAINSRLHVNTGWSHIKNMDYLRILACRSDFQQFWLTDRLTDRLTDWMADRLKDEYNLVCIQVGAILQHLRALSGVNNNDQVSLLVVAVGGSWKVVAVWCWHWMTLHVRGHLGTSVYQCM